MATLKTNSLKKRLTHHLKKSIPYKYVIDKFLGTIVSVNTQKKIAALTFDDGPDPEWTPKVLDVLDKYNAKATFFVIGNKVGKFPEVVQQVSDAGHAIANHSWDHPSMTEISRNERFKQFNKTGNAISDYDCKLFRPPFGVQSFFTRLEAERNGYTVVCWDTHARDWEIRTPDIMFNELHKKVHPGAIILLHDSSNGTPRDSMIQALEMFLEKNPDYQFVTLPEMLTQGVPKKIYWVKKAGVNDLESHKRRLL